MSVAQYRTTHWTWCGNLPVQCKTSIPLVWKVAHGRPNPTMIGWLVVCVSPCSHEWNPAWQGKLPTPWRQQTVGASRIG